DVAADAEQLRATVLLGPELREPVGAVPDDQRHVAERLDVVDGARRRPETGHRRKRRLDARLGTLAFERLDERRLFAGFIGAGAAEDVDLAVEAGAEDVPADVARLASGLDLGLEPALHVVELAADVDVGDLRADRVTRDETALDEQVRVPLHEDVVLEGARLALVGVAADVLRLQRVLLHELPLHAGGEARPAAATQARLLDFLDDVVRLHAERLLQRLITVLPLEIEVERVAVALAHERGQVQFHLAPLSRPRARGSVRPRARVQRRIGAGRELLLDVQVAPAQRRAALLANGVDERAGIFRTGLLVPVVVDHDHRRAVARTET